MITEEIIKRVFPHAKKEIVNALIENEDELSKQYEIDSPLKWSHFLAQTGHESGGFTTVEENLNYRSETLAAVFPKYFKDVDPDDYAHQPAKIANHVYANRMGNGDEESGEGYKFRGRGLIQLTGKSNYSAMAHDLGVDLDDLVNHLATADGAVESAAWFWHKNGINKLAEEDNVLAVTKKVNGGTIGLQERTNHTEKLKEILGA
jgi:putative chitinase